MRKTIFGALLFLPFVVLGQTANPLIVTWQANSYFPADYTGKVAATPNSPIIVSVELIQKGKLADITGADIKWYVGNLIIANGVGQKTASFAATQSGNGYQNIRVSVSVGNASFDNSVRIPIVKPSVVITSFLKNQSVKPGDEVVFQALPFFFNVDSIQKLAFFWQINNQSAAGDGNKLTIKVGTPKSDFQNSILVSATAQNSDNPYEFNKGSLNLSITQ